MKHYGDICNINGAEVEPVDVIIGGSPCQDLSVAGKRAGLDGERSGLFMEQIRIIKEMRDATNGTSPRYMVWENVPGAFSSNKGEDFRIVVEETAKIADETAVIPRPDKGKWANSGAIMGDGWSIAWRVFDAQFWGVPQRRRRIALVADFGGQSASEILFEQDSLYGHLAESGTAGEGVAGGVAGSTYPAVARSLTARHDSSPCIDRGQNVVVAGFCQGASPAAQTIGYQEEVLPTIKGAPSGTAQVPAVLFEPKSALEENWAESNVKNALRAGESKSSHAVFDARGNGDGSIAPTMTGDHQNRVTDYTGIAVNQSVRRLTPLECERLQGYEDGWTNIPPQTKVTADDLSFWRTVWNEWQEMNGAKPKTDKQIIKWLKSEPADSARYKALGNSIALPPWRFVLSRIHEQGARTMASLFDGIGGFPKIWQELGGQTLWCSEVEPFPIAVTRYHFKEATNATR